MAVKKKGARKKPGKKPKKMPAVRTAKTVKKDLRSLRKGLRKEAVITQRVKRKTAAHDKELDLLRKELEALKKKKKKSVLSEYNRFMRAQIMGGLTFKQAVRLWNKGKKDAAKKNRRRTSYNIFISMQLKQGKTMRQAIRAWNLLKNPPKRRRRKPARKVIARVVRRVAPKRKPKRKKPARRKPVRKPKGKRAVRRASRRRPRRKLRRTVFRRTVRRFAEPQKQAALSGARVFNKLREVTVEKPVIVTKEVFPEERAREIVSGVLGRPRHGVEARSDVLKKLVSKETVSKGGISAGFSNEEIVLELLDIYFTEVIRHGMRRRLTLDEMINAYFYALLRVERKGIELKEIEKIIAKGVIRKENFRGEKASL
jgi:hypothetical protein